MLLPIAGIVFLTCVLLWHAAQFYPFISDDALISMRYAQRLVDGEGLTWSNGLPVEGYSNLLWTLLLSFSGFLGIDLVFAARTMGVVCIGLIPVLLLYAMRRDTTVEKLVTLALLALFPLNASAAAWAIGGLEMPLTALLLVMALVLLDGGIEKACVDRRIALHSGLLLGFASINRPDGLLFPVAIVMVLLGFKIFRKLESRFIDLFLVVAIPLLFAAGQMVFRFVYYAELLPNTAYVKLSFSRFHMGIGWDYVLQGISVQWPFWILVAAAFGLLFVRRDRAAVLFIVPVLAWFGYVTVAGGDYAPAFRLLLPAVAMGMLPLLKAGRVLAAAPLWSRRPITGLSALILLCVAAYPVFYVVQHESYDIVRAREEVWEWDGKILAETLHAAFHGRDPFIAVTAAGCIPYWSGFRSIDMLGLNDRHIAHRRPRSRGFGPVGHELGDARYVLDQKPDMIILNVGDSSSQYREYEDTMRTQAFRNEYVAVSIAAKQAERKKFTVWMRRESPRIGIKKWADSLRIPGYFLRPLYSENDSIRQGIGAQAVFLDRNGVLVQPLQVGQRLAYAFPGESYLILGIRLTGNNVSHVMATRDGERLVLQSTDGDAMIEHIVLQVSRNTMQAN
ncbi:MAG: hypothetical protein IH600_12755 [Bacteroidetes bacterium]|nr:hypothetical protein [Bacteroidota bacterium]